MEVLEGGRDTHEGKSREGGSLRRGRKMGEGDKEGAPATDAAARTRKTSAHTIAIMIWMGSGAREDMS